jgi:homoserine dehydrogenase
MREALERRIPVVTFNKWPVALRGVELAQPARSRGVAFRAESTVMSGMPLLSAVVDGLAGAVPVGLRGLLNASFWRADSTGRAAPAAPRGRVATDRAHAR